MNSQKHYLWLFFYCAFICQACGHNTDKEIETYDQQVQSMIDSDFGLEPDLSVNTEDMAPVQGEDPSDCDPLQPDYCALPWPSNHFLQTNRTANSQLKRSFKFQDTTLPKNFQGAPFASTIFDGLDGYGLLASGMVYFENIDPSQLPSELDIERSMGPNTIVVLLKIDRNELGQILGTRIPCWAELDLRANTDGPQTLFLRPAQLLEPDQEYAYALVNLVNLSGERIKSSPAFISLRDGLGTSLEGDRLISPTRRAYFEELFEALAQEGITREQLTLAWRFHTASTESLTNDLIHMRDHALAQVDAEDIEFEISEVKRFRQPNDENPDLQGQPSHPSIAVEIKGLFEVPNFMEEDGVLPGEYQIHRDSTGQPTSRGTVMAPFWLRIPHRALNGEEMGMIIYGHGQLYSGAEVRAGDKGPVAEEYGYVYLGTDLWGMSEDELPLIPQVLNQMERFTAIADRLHQGVTNHLVLARLAKTKLALIPWLQENNINLDIDKLVYGGISQGGIFGPTILALSQDVTRGHFGVPGLHYFTLIGRSRNFNAMFSLLNVAYSDPVECWITLAAAQLLWNKTDPSTYYRHLALEPFSDTPLHQVLLSPAQGDPQVSQLTIEHLSRSNLEIPILQPYADQNIPLAQTTEYPHLGSGIVGWHYGPRTPLGAGPAPSSHHDPHEQSRNDDLHNLQMVHFWETGEIIDVCMANLCGTWSP